MADGGGEEPTLRFRNYAPASADLAPAAAPAAEPLALGGAGAAEEGARAAERPAVARPRSPPRGDPRRAARERVTHVVARSVCAPALT